MVRLCSCDDFDNLLLIGGGRLDYVVDFVGCRFIVVDFVGLLVLGWKGEWRIEELVMAIDLLAM